MCILYSFLKIYFIDYAITVVPFSPLSPLPCTPHPPSFPHLSSCPWVIHISPLATPFPILFLTSPFLFCTCQFAILNPCTFPSLSPFRLSTDNPLNDPHFYDSVSVLLFCLVCFSSRFNCRWL